MRSLWSDLAYGWRRFKAAPGVSAVVVISLAVGIGANAVVFSWYQTLVRQPLAGVADQDRLVVVLHEPHGSDLGHSVTDLDLRDLTGHGDVFVDGAAHTQWALLLEHGRRERWIWSQPVAGPFFEILGVEPILGRTLEPTPLGRRVAAPEAVLGHRLWTELFDRDPGVIGQRIRLNRVSFTVVGVAPPGFEGAVGGLGFDVFIPLATASLLGEGGPLGSRSSAWVYGIARLQPGVALGEAQALARTVSRQLAAAYPNTNEGRTIVVRPLWECPYGAQELVTPVLHILMIITTLVLMLVLANLANLQLARATTRGKELAVRQALGARRPRLVRQLLTESLLLGLLGGGLGVLLATWGVRALRLMPIGTDLPVVLSLSLDPRALLLSLALAVTSGLVLGLSPALQLSRVHSASALRAEGRTVGAAGGPQRLRHGLIVAETALATLVLVGAGLCLKSFRSALEVDRGFEPAGVVVAPLEVDGEVTSGNDLRASLHRLVRELGTLPSVAQVSLADWVPLGNRGFRGAWITPDGYQPEPSEDMSVGVTVVSPGHLENLEVPLLEGREATEADDTRSPDVVVVNRALADRYWPGQSVVGRHVGIWGRRFRVIGVAGNWKHNRLTDAPIPMLIVSSLQVDVERDRAVLFLRSRGDAGTLIAAVEKRVQAVDPGLHVRGAMPMTEFMDVSMAAQRLAAVLMTVLAGVALLLASLGIFGVLAYVVSQRVREIGLRIALGAAPRDIFGLVLRQAALLILLGIGLGLVLATTVFPRFSGFLVDVEAVDPFLYLGVAALFALVGALASSLPARQALRVDPVEAMRSE